MNPYSTHDIDWLWSDEYTLSLWGRVERALLTTQAEHLAIPSEYALLAEATPLPTVEEWRLHTAEAGHEMVGFLHAWGVEHVHIGVTSSDIIDTANAIRYRQINDIIETDTYRLREALIAQAQKHLHTLRVGRTHGQAATLTTFAHKLADLAYQTDRAATRLQHARVDLEIGKLSGPTGGHHHIPPNIEQATLSQLHLRPTPVATQIIARDSTTHWANTLIGIVETTAALATEIRLGQHHQIAEIAEPHQAPHYRGSSSMPNKRNPTNSERISGLARIARATYAPLAESVEQWHERDISQSSVERTLLPLLTGITHYAITWALDTVNRLHIDPIRAQTNIEQTGSALGRHSALHHQQTCGVPYREATVDNITIEPSLPDIDHLEQQINQLGKRPKEHR